MLLNILQSKHGRGREGGGPKTKGAGKEWKTDEVEIDDIPKAYKGQEL